jgi:hypothetical protein
MVENLKIESGWRKEGKKHEITGAGRAFMSGQHREDVKKRGMAALD